MVMREGSRRWLLRLSWAGLIASLSLWLGLWLGRPLYYTDGQQQLRADELQHDGMLRWPAPEVVVELPGRLAGRVAQLPDGRLCFGLLQPDGSSDLVLFDPQRPQVLPERAHGLNTAHTELAPALGTDGTLYFASDRPGGRGGYDLYTSRWERGGFLPPIPFEASNTAQDETDPAPSPDGSTLVFVRIDREERGPDDGRLHALQLGSELAAAPLFDEPVGQRQARRADRDPAFSADGGELWFVRKQLGEPARLLRSSVHRGQWDEARPANDHWGLGAVRAPLPSADGLRLYVLQPARGEQTGDLWYVSTAQELHPFRLGQRWLEWLLLGVALTCLLLLILLHLGRRWTALDLLVQCLLLSLLLHVLLFLWLMGVEITAALVPGDDAGTSLQVSIVHASQQTGTSSGAGQVQHDVAAMAQFEVREATIAATAPGAALAAAAAALPGPSSRVPVQPAADAQRDRMVAQQLQDAVTTAAALRAGEAAPVAVASADLPTMAASQTPAAAAAATARAVSAGQHEQLLVQAPGIGLLSAPLAASSTLGAPSPSREPPSPRSLPVAAASVDDAAVVGAGAAPLRGVKAVPDEVAASGARPLAGPAAASLPAPARTTDAGDSAGTKLLVTEPAAALAGPSGAARLGAARLQAAAALPSTPVAGAHSPSVSPRNLRDAPSAAAPTVAVSNDSPAAASPVSIAVAELPPLQSAAAGAADASRELPRVAAGLAAPAPALAPGSQLTAQGVHTDKAAVAALQAPRHATPTPRRPGPALRDVPAAAAAVDAARADTNSPVAGATQRAASAQQSAQQSRLQPALLPALAGPVASVPLPPRPQPPHVLGKPLSTGLRHPGSLWDRVPLAPLAVAAELREQSAYSNRFGPAKAAAIEQFGGNAQTERAVRDGLRYLARIQGRDGSWGDRRRFDDKYGLVYVGKTGLCLLAFLGAGHTPTSNTEHSEVVTRALAHLLQLQDPDNGAFGPSSCYGHGIATYALAECYGLTKDPALLPPLENALVWLLAHQGPRKDRKNRGGWGYFSPGLGAEDSYARVSVTSWMVMALESARLSGIELPEEALPRAREYLELSFDEPNGWFRYNHNPSRLRSQWPTLPASTPAGAFCLMLLGVDKDDARIDTAVGYTAERRPQSYRRYRDDDFVLNGQGNVYFWYYGSLACFLRGGKAWEHWNERLKTVLPAGQEEDGSFPPIDQYARYAGDSDADRSYTTAMCVLSLEVYYRYFTPLLIGR